MAILVLPVISFAQTEIASSVNPPMDVFNTISNNPPPSSGSPVSNPNTGNQISQITNVNGLFNKITGIGDMVIYLLIALAVVFIIWNIVIYFIKGSEEATRAKVGMQILWGIVGLAIIISLWGLVNILVTTFATGRNTPNQGIPSANFLNSNK